MVGKAGQGRTTSGGEAMNASDIDDVFSAEIFWPRGDYVPGLGAVERT